MLDHEHIRLMRDAAKAEREIAADHERAGRIDAAANCLARAVAYEERAGRAESRLQVEAAR